MNLEFLKKTELEILKDVAAFCEENNMKYFLSFGTLIGAVRHKGFIPWDDDIDICMFREDYEKFIRAYSSKGNYYKVTSYLDDNYIYPFAKVYDTRYPIRENTRFDCNIGIYIDIFPLDVVNPENKLFVKRLFNLKVLWSALNNPANVKSKNILRRITAACSSNKRLNGLVRKAEKLVKKNTDEKSGFVSTYHSVEKNGFLLFYAEDFKPALMTFEGYDFCVPENYDRFLRTVFGDYMTLPPEEERVSAHDFTLKNEAEKG